MAIGLALTFREIQLLIACLRMSYGRGVFELSDLRAIELKLVETLKVSKDIHRNSKETA